MGKLLIIEWAVEKALADVVAACIAGPVCPWKTVEIFSTDSASLVGR